MIDKWVRERFANNFGELTGSSHRRADGLDTIHRESEKQVTDALLLREIDLRVYGDTPCPRNSAVGRDLLMRTLGLVHKQDE